jgi:hypothetical protein
MSEQTTVLLEKKILTPLSSVALQHAAVRSEPDHSARPMTHDGFDPGHDFSQVPAHTTPATSGAERSTACPVFPRTCPFGGACHVCPARVQAKLAISQPDDAYEHEADHVAETVMRMPGPEDEDKERCRQPGCAGMVQRQATNAVAPSEAPPIVHEALRSPGQPIDTATRAFMEPRFGQDFSRVRVHTDTKAARSTEAVNALAYTVGSDVVFGAGRYLPQTAQGQHLLAHELTHVVQQATSLRRPNARELLIDPSSCAERQGLTVANKVIAPDSAPNGSCNPALRLRCLPLTLQRSTGQDRCSGSGAKCAPAERCARPDSDTGGSQAASTAWTLLVNIDIERSSWQSALRNQEFGHTYVKFLDSNGRRYSYGFYPSSILPNENRRTVPGCVHHPDTTHDACIDDTVMYSLNESQYNAGLGYAQGICRTGHTYGVDYTCTTFAEETVRAAGQSLPSSRSAPTEVFYQRIPSIDNPNTLYENVQKERQRAPYRRFPFWNNPCMNRCEAEFDECLRTNRRGGMACIPPRERCMRGCPKP